MTFDLETELALMRAGDADDIPPRERPSPDEYRPDPRSWERRERQLDDDPADAQGELF